MQKKTDKRPSVHSHVEKTSGLPISRRGFVYGAAAVGAACAIGGITFAATGGFAKDEELASLTVPQNAVFTTENCEYIEDAKAIMENVVTASLPYGTLVWATDPSIAACLLPTDQGKPLAQIGLISLSNGNVSTVLSAAVGQNDGFEIYDARATSSGVVWTEADILDGNWRIYQATLNGTQLGEPKLMMERDSEWEMPTLSAGGNYCFWQVLPQLDGAARREDSVMMCAAFGDDQSLARTLYSSHGRMACSPSPTDTGIAFAPRANTDDVRYQLMHVDAQTGDVTDTLVLPASMKPIYVAHGNTGFSFAFDGIYNYGDGISNLGTYTPVQAPGTDLASALELAEDALRDKDGNLSEKALLQAETDAQNTLTNTYSQTPWFRFPRTPVTPPAWLGNWFIVKSTRAIAGVNVADKRYFTIDVENGAPDYGEFLASYGNCGNVVTYTNINYTPINGDPVNECRVKIWKTV